MGNVDIDTSVIEPARVGAAPDSALNQLKSFEVRASLSNALDGALDAVAGLGKLARESSDPRERLERLKALGRNARRLVGLVEDALDLSEIEEGRMEVGEVPFAVDALLEDLRSAALARIGDKALTFKIERVGQLPRRLVSDPARIKQALVSLIGTAVKSIEGGSITLRVSTSDAGAAYAVLNFSVVEAGSGSSLERRVKPPRPFAGIDGPMARERGEGLALPWVIAQALGGKLWLETDGIGTDGVFRFTIVGGAIDAGAGGARGGKTGCGTEGGIDDGTEPSSAARPGADAATGAADPVAGALRPSPPPDRALEGLSILLVEDSPDNQLLISRYLTAAGAALKVAGNGRVGVDEAMRGEFDVVLMDLQMPVMDGYEAVAELRRRKFRRPVLALTAHALIEEKPRALSSGFDDYLTKPVNRKQLIERLRRAGREESAGREQVIRSAGSGRLRP